MPTAKNVMAYLTRELFTARIEKDTERIAALKSAQVIILAPAFASIRKYAAFRTH